MDHNNILAVVLAGGKSKRFGRDKSQVKLGDKILIDYILSEIIDIYNDILIVANEPIKFLDSNKISFQIIFTKIDKINKKEKEVLIKGMQFHKLIRSSNPFFTSSKTKLGVKDIKKQIIDNLKNNE